MAADTDLKGALQHKSERVFLSKKIRMTGRAIDFSWMEMRYTLAKRRQARGKRCFA